MGKVGGAVLALLLLQGFVFAAGCTTTGEVVLSDKEAKDTQVYVQSIKTNVFVGSIVGIDINRTVLTFGVLPRGSDASRQVDIKNEQSSTIRISFEILGNISDMIYFSEENFLLEPDESRMVDAIIQIPANKQEGYYEGEIKIYVEILPE